MLNRLLCRREPNSICTSRTKNSQTSLTFSFLGMSRRLHSASPADSPRLSKRPKLEHLTSEDFKGGVFLAPMVRSGALPTRLYALKHGANLVWGPEMVDRAILNAERVVDPITGLVSYNGKTRAMFTTHPIEKPYFIYQIGSSDPDLAVQAAKTVMQDVSGIDLNCGCPKPFSTHAGMGAALLTNPDLLCSILTALREAMPPEITVTAKIRLLPTQEDTLKLVERIINCGVSAITIHCRTRNMRPREAALIERLREIVEFVEGLGKGIAVIENGDCVSFEDAKRIRQVTGAHSVMIATAAEANPTCFSPEPLTDLEDTLIPAYIRLSKYLDNHWGLTKFCANQFKATRLRLKKAETQELHQRLSVAKNYDAVADIIGFGTGEDEFRQIEQVIASRPDRYHTVVSLAREVQDQDVEDQDEEVPLSTPPERENPEPPSLNAPHGPTHPLRMTIPAGVSGRDAPTPTPGGGIPLVAI